MSSTLKSAPSVLTAKEKALACLELRKSGMTWEQIGNRGIYADKATAYNAVMRLIEATQAEAGEELRAMMNARYDEALLAIWPRVQQGDLEAIDRMLKIEAQRAKLYGIDAPTRTEIYGALDLTNPELAPAAIIAARIDELAAKRDERRLIDVEATG